MPNSERTGDQPTDRILMILEEVVRRGAPVTASEIGEALDLPTATVHRMVSQLIDRRVLKRAFGSKRVLVGSRLVDLAAGALESAISADRPHTILTALANEIGEHCQLGIVVNNEVLYVDSARSGRSSGLHFEPGRRSPLHCTSIGKVYLAEMDEKSRSRWLGDNPLHAMTPKTITDRKRLEDVLRSVRSQAWASSDEEIAIGVVGCAVPVRNRENALIAAIGISAPSARIPFSKLDDFLPKLRKAARQISEAIDDAPAGDSGDLQMLPALPR